MEIGEFSKIVGLPASTLRYYERIGLLPAPRRVSGRRIYRATDVSQGVMLATARRLGFSIRELRQIAQPGLELGAAKAAAARKADALAQEVRDLLQKRDALLAISRCDCDKPALCLGLQGGAR